MAAAGAGGLGGLGLPGVQYTFGQNLFGNELTPTVVKMLGAQVANSTKIAGVEFRDIFEHFPPTKQCIEVIGGPTTILEDVLKENATKLLLPEVIEQLTRVKQKRKDSKSGVASVTCWICGLQINESVEGLKSECEHVLPVIQAAIFLELYGATHDTIKNNLDALLKKRIEADVLSEKSKKKGGDPIDTTVLDKQLLEAQNKYIYNTRILKLEYLWAHGGCNRVKDDTCFLTRGIIQETRQPGAIINETMIKLFLKDLYYTSNKAGAPKCRELIYKTYSYDPAGANFNRFVQDRLVYFRDILKPICQYINDCNGAPGVCTVTFDDVCAAGATNLLSSKVVNPAVIPVIANVVNNINIAKGSLELNTFSRLVWGNFSTLLTTKFSEELTKATPAKFASFKAILYGKIDIFLDFLYNIYSELILRIFLLLKDNVIIIPPSYQPISKKGELLPPIKIENPNEFIAVYFYNIFFLKCIGVQPSSPYLNKKYNDVIVIEKKTISEFIRYSYVYANVIADLKLLEPNAFVDKNNKKSVVMAGVVGAATAASVASVSTMNKGAIRDADTAEKFIDTVTADVLANANSQIEELPKGDLVANITKVAAKTAGDDVAIFLNPQTPEQAAVAQAAATEVFTNTQAASTATQIQNILTENLSEIQPVAVPPGIKEALNRELALIATFSQAPQLQSPDVNKNNIVNYSYDLLITENGVAAAQPAITNDEKIAIDALLQMNYTVTNNYIGNFTIWNETEKTQLKDLKIFQSLLYILELAQKPYTLNVEDLENLNTMIDIIDALEIVDISYKEYLKTIIYTNNFLLFSEIIAMYINDLAEYSNIYHTNQIYDLITKVREKGENNYFHYLSNSTNRANIYNTLKPSSFDEYTKNLYLLHIKKIENLQSINRAEIQSNLSNLFKYNQRIRDVAEEQASAAIKQLISAAKTVEKPADAFQLMMQSSLEQARAAKAQLETDAADVLVSGFARTIQNDINITTTSSLYYIGQDGQTYDIDTKLPVSTFYVGQDGRTYRRYDNQAVPSYYLGNDGQTYRRYDNQLQVQPLYQTVFGERRRKLDSPVVVAGGGRIIRKHKRRHSKTHVKKRQGRKQKHAKTIRRRSKQQVKKRPIKTHRRRVLKRNKSRKYRT